jgi:hypothetical protein
MNRTEKIFAEALLRAAVIANAEREMQELEANTTEIHFSERHEERMRRLFSRERAKVKYTKISRAIYKTAIAAAIALAVLSTALIFNQTVRAVISDVIVEWFGHFTNFKSATENIKTEHVEWTFGYVPDDFAEQSAISTDGYTNVLYTNPNGVTLSLTVYPSGTGSTGIDNEHSQYRTMYEGDVEYYIFFG